MQSRITGALSVGAALLALAVPASLQADPGASQFTGYGVGGWAETTAGCLRTNLWLGADIRANRFPPAAGERSSWLSVELEQYDVCAPAPDPPATFVGVGDMQMDEGMLAGDMRAADLRVTVSMFDNVTGMRVPLTLDLHWDGDGDVTRYPGVYHFGDGVNCHSMWEYRDATLSGAVSGPGIEVFGIFEHGGSVQSSREGCTNQ